MSKPVDGNQFFNQAEASFIKLWSSDTTEKDFKELAWALINTNKALQWALNDIHNHVRQQQPQPQPQPSTQPAAWIRTSR